MTSISEMHCKHGLYSCPMCPMEAELTAARARIADLEAWGGRWKRLAQALRVRGVHANQTAHVAVMERVMEHYEARLDERDAEIADLQAALEEASAPSETWQRLEALAGKMVALNDDLDREREAMREVCEAAEEWASQRSEVRFLPEEKRLYAAQKSYRERAGR